MLVVKLNCVDACAGQLKGITSPSEQHAGYTKLLEGQVTLRNYVQVSAQGGAKSPSVSVLALLALTYATGKTRGARLTLIPFSRWPTAC